MVAVKTIVPGQFSIVAQPTPEDIGILAQQGFKTLISNRPDNETEGQPTAAQMRDAAHKHGLVYIHLPVTVGSISRRDMEAFRDALKTAELPVVAHGGTGKRAYLLWAAGEVLYNGRASAELVEQAAGVGLEAIELQHIVKRISDET